MSRRDLASVWQLVGPVLVAAALPCGLGAQEWTEAERVVWQAEQTYFEHSLNDDLDGYLATWHDQLLAWPGFAVTP